MSIKDVDRDDVSARPSHARTVSVPGGAPTTADRAYHGRVISIYEMLWSLMLFASLPVGVAVDHVGAPVTVAVFGGLVALVVLALSPARLKTARPEPAD